MDAFLVYALLVLLLTAVGVIFKNPQVSISLFLGVYSSEQLLMTKVAFLRSHISFFNYSIGLFCVAAMLIGFVKSGKPKLSKQVVIFSVFFLFTCASFLWSPAPESASYALTHFFFEGWLAVLLPYFVIRKVQDMQVVILYLGGIALISSLSLILSPTVGVAGRVLLIEKGTVLSPGTLIGSALIFLAVCEKEELGKFLYAKYPAMVIMGISCFLSGARTQFFASVGLASILLLVGHFKKRIIEITIYGIILIIGMSIFIVPNDLLNSIMGASGRYESQALEVSLGSRLEILKTTLTFDAPIWGHGLMSWGHSITGKDIYLYPHNSILQLYFEVGLVGLTLFLWLIYTGLQDAFSAYKVNKELKKNQRILSGLLAYLAFGFILSLKQETFLSCTSVYIALSLLANWKTIINFKELPKSTIPEASTKIS